MKLMILMVLIGAAVIIVNNICGSINEERRNKLYDNQDLIDEKDNV